MRVKFIARGAGSAKATADYLLGERDAARQLHDGVEVCRGDPDMVAAVADSLEFQHRYTSGVIAWEPEDRPADAQIKAVLGKLEKMVRAGLEPDRYAWSTVEHRERAGAGAGCSASSTASCRAAPTSSRRFAGHVTRLSADYTTLAETLRGPWR